jgi:hypothetical protein
MTFFNKNEEILEIKLSSFGKQKLAAGTLKPVYYAFFDDDILYDAARAGITEDNNNIEPRIQENTPSLRVQTSFTDLELRIMKQTHELNENGVYENDNIMDLKNDPSVFQDYDGLRNALPLGNSQLGNQFLASWRVELLEGGYKNYKSTTKESTSCAAPFQCQKPIVNIPQINVDLAVQPTIVDKDFVGIVDPETGRLASINPDSNQFIRLQNDFILIDVEELNVDLFNDSFSLEVYEIIEDPDNFANQETLHPKLFKKQIEPIIDGIMLEKDEIEQQISNAEVDGRFADYYFNIMVDDEIDSKTKFEKIISREFKGNIFDNNVGYEEFHQTPGSKLYTSDNDGGEC